MADIEDLMPLIKQFMPFAKERMGFQDPPKLFLKGDSENASNPLGRTAFYDPAEKAVTLYITGRHPKDIMRSLSHELVHHRQNCNGDFKNAGEMGEGYAQNNPHMREMERQAYEIGNMCFRDWEDSIKQTIYFEHLQKGDKTMSTKDWKNKEIKSLLSEAWGFKMDLDQLNEGSDQKGKKGADEDVEGVATGYNAPKQESLQTEDSGKEEKRHYEDDDWSDKDRLDAILDHAHKLRKDMDYDHDHEALQEESGEDEKHHYEHDDWSDKERLEQIVGHAEALRKDMDYDHDHEALEEGDETETIEEEEEIEERRRRGRATPAATQGRVTPGEVQQESIEAKMRDMVRQLIKDSMK
jgi:ubiquitin